MAGRWAGRQGPRCIVGYFTGCEAQASREVGIDLKVGGWAGDGVIDAILGVYHAGNLLNGVFHPGPS